MRLSCTFAAVATFALLAAACASKSGASTAEPAEPAESLGPRWTGNLQPVQQRTGGLAVTGQNRAFGAVTVTRAVGRLERMMVRLNVAVPTIGASSLTWAVIPERCGSGGLPLLGYEQFPLIEISTNGRGELQAELPLVLSSNSTYHVNVYSGGHQLEHVVTCANLRFQSATSRTP